MEDLAIAVTELDFTAADNEWRVSVANLSGHLG